MSPHALLWAGAIVFAAGAGFSPRASAVVINGVYGAELEYVTGGVIVRDGSGETFQGRNWDKLPNRVTQARDALKSNIGGGFLEYEAKRKALPLAVLEAGGTVLGRAVPALGAGLLLYDLFESMRIHESPDATGLLEDPGTDPIPGGTGDGPPIIWCTAYMCGSGDQYSSLEAVPGAALAKWITGHPYSYGGTPPDDWYSNAAPSLVGSPTYTDTGSAMNVSQPMDYTNKIVGTGVVVVHSSVGVTGLIPYCLGGSPYKVATRRASNPITSRYVCPGTVQPSSCPASTDPFNPEYNVPAGSPIGDDGKCPTARYNWRGINAPDAAAKVEQYRPPTGDQLRDLADDIVTRGGEIQAESPLEVDGPLYGPEGTPRVSVRENPDGSTVTTTETPTVKYTYEGDKITYITTTITTVETCTAPGSCTTSTDREEKPVEETDQCKANPDSLGCAKFGKIPDDKPQWQSKDVPFEVEDLGLGAGCPAPVTWDVFDMALTWSYQPVCDVAPVIRLALLVFASIGAIGVIIRETT